MYYNWDNKVELALRLVQIRCNGEEGVDSEVLDAANAVLLVALKVHTATSITSSDALCQANSVSKEL